MTCFFTTGGGELVGKVNVTLRSKDNGFPSRGDFTNIAIKPGRGEKKMSNIVYRQTDFLFFFKLLAGSYVLEVQSASDPTVSLSMDDPICVGKKDHREHQLSVIHLLSLSLSLSTTTQETLRGRPSFQRL